MTGLRLILRASPFLLGALAAALWLRRGQVARLQLEPPKAAAEPAAPPVAEPAEPPAGPDARPPSGRFERRSIDIVTVVDDLLVPGAS
jgi:hypothetical protein